MNTTETNVKAEDQCVCLSWFYEPLREQSSIDSPSVTTKQVQARSWRCAMIATTWQEFVGAKEGSKKEQDIVRVNGVLT